MSLVSVVIPVKNPPKALFLECLDSIKNQTLSDFECLIVDDYNTEMQAEEIKNIVDKLDSRFRYIKSDVNPGVAYARNLGLSLVSSDYVTFCDCDDVLSHKKLQKQYEILSSRAGYICSLVGLQMNYENKLIKRTRIRRTYFNVDPFVSLLRANIAFCGSNAMFKKSFLDSHNIRFDPRYPYADDWGILLDCARIGGQGSIHYNSSNLLTYNRHNTSISATRAWTLRESVSRLYLENVNKLTREQKELFYGVNLYNYREIIFKNYYNVDIGEYGLACEYESYEPNEGIEEVLYLVDEGVEDCIKPLILIFLFSICLPLLAVLLTLKLCL